MLGGLCAARNNCRDMDDESPDDASGIVSNFSVYKRSMCFTEYCMVNGEGTVRTISDFVRLTYSRLSRCRAAARRACRIDPRYDNDKLDSITEPTSTSDYQRINHQPIIHWHTTLCHSTLLSNSTPFHFPKIVAKVVP
jgi:hypothetical protein